MRYYPAVGPAIPHSVAGCSRVTHPFAGDPCGPPRLACVKHAASVRPEPGSNSPMDRSIKTLPNASHQTDLIDHVRNHLICRSLNSPHRSSGPDGSTSSPRTSIIPTRLSNSSGVAFPRQPLILLRYVRFVKAAQPFRKTAAPASPNHIPTRIGNVSKDTQYYRLAQAPKLHQLTPVHLKPHLK